MDRHVLVPLLKTVVLADVVQVVTSDNDGPLHLHLGHHTYEHPSLYFVILHLQINLPLIQNRTIITA